MSGIQGGKWHVVITGAKSRSHLVYVASYLRWLLERERAQSVKVSFIQAPNFLSAPSVTLTDLQDLVPPCAQLHYVAGLEEYQFDAGARGVYVSVGSPGISMLGHLLRANRRRRFGVVVTDEGIGTYGSFRTRHAAMRRQGADPTRAFLKAAAMGVAAKIFTTTRWAAYENSHGCWQVAPPVAQEFRRHVERSQPGTTNRAVILTQPFADLGLMSAEEHLAYVDTICASVVDVGLQPVIRPHPAEDVSKYGARPLMRARGTAELDPEVVEASLVLGGPSTALVNVSAMYGSRALWVSIPGLEHLDTDVSRNQAAIFKAFLGEPVAAAGVATALRPPTPPAG